MTTHYDTLGIDKTASASDIKTAYRKLASVHHPDKDSGNTAKFQEIQSAYAILENPDKRATYDQQLAGGGQFRFDTSGGMDDDIFAHMRNHFGFNFGPGRPFQQHQSHPKTNSNIRVAYQFSLVDSLTEQVKIINVAFPNGKKTNVEIKIPRGIQHGITIRYPNLGDDAIATMPRGDLYIQFHQRPEQNFEAAGFDIITSLTVNCLEAVTGCTKDVHGIDGKVFAIVIPPGTQYGAKFGIQQQGLYSTENPGRGRLVVTLEIYVPKELSESQLETIRSINQTL